MGHNTPTHGVVRLQASRRYKVMDVGGKEIQRFNNLKAIPSWVIPAHNHLITQCNWLMIILYSKIWYALLTEGLFLVKKVASYRLWGQLPASFRAAASWLRGSHPHTGGSRPQGGILALRAHCALLLDYVPPEEPLGTPLGNTLRIRRPKLD